MKEFLNFYWEYDYVELQTTNMNHITTKIGWQVFLSFVFHCHSRMPFPLIQRGMLFVYCKARDKVSMKRWFQERCCSADVLLYLVRFSKYVPDVDRRQWNEPYKVWPLDRLSLRGVPWAFFHSLSIWFGALSEQVGKCGGIFWCEEMNLVAPFSDTFPYISHTLEATCVGQWRCAAATGGRCQLRDHVSIVLWVTGRTEGDETSHA